MTILFNFSTTSNHLHPLQVENCDSNSRLVVDEVDRLERVKTCLSPYICGSSRTRVSIFSGMFNINNVDIE